MRVIAGILLIIVAIVPTVIGLMTITGNIDIYLVQPARALPSLLAVLAGLLLGFSGYRTIKRR